MCHQWRTAGDDVQQIVCKQLVQLDAPTNIQDSSIVLAMISGTF